MCKIINFENLGKLATEENDLKRPETEHQIIHFAEMDEGIDDARILHAKISLFAKKLIDEGFEDSLVYQQLFKTAESMSCLYTESHSDFIYCVHDELAKFNPEICYQFLNIDDT